MAASVLGRRPSKVPSKDGRSPDGVLLRRTKAALTTHVGGKPSVTQVALIDRACMLTLHLARMDARAMVAGEFSDHASRHYLAWSGHLARILALLGLDAPRVSFDPVADLQAHFARRAAEKAAGAAAAP